MFSLSELTDQWEVTMSFMLQKFQLRPEYTSTTWKNIYPFGRSSDNRPTDRNTKSKNYPNGGFK